MITQGTLEYQVIGNPPDSWTRIWLRDVNRHFFDAFPGKESSHLEDAPGGRRYYIKKFKRGNTEVWLTCYELDMNGRRDGVLDPDEEPQNLVALSGQNMGTVVPGVTAVHKETL